jgi:hypothetical protein
LKRSRYYLKKPNVLIGDKGRRIGQGWEDERSQEELSKDFKVPVDKKEKSGLAIFS